MNQGARVNTNSRTTESNMSQPEHISTIIERVIKQIAEVNNES